VSAVDAAVAITVFANDYRRANAAFAVVVVERKHTMPICIPFDSKWEPVAVEVGIVE
jgi:hypothetical protein